MSTFTPSEPAHTGHAVVIAGAGPTGLMLAGELALAGIDVAIVERRATPHTCIPRKADGASTPACRTR
jgi:2-polyprenyl-6-methoxyphenol hydroxylase-like FAD-dependent oxidoreductase